MWAIKTTTKKITNSVIISHSIAIHHYSQRKRRKHPKISKAWPRLLMKIAGADVTKHFGASVMWPHAGLTRDHEKWATAVTEQNTSTSYCIHQGITKISPESISRSHGEGSAFLFVFLLLGCLLIVIIPLSSTSCLDTFQKAMHLFFLFL